MEILSKRRSPEFLVKRNKEMIPNAAIRYCTQIVSQTITYRSIAHDEVLDRLKRDDVPSICMRPLNAGAVVCRGQFGQGLR